MHQPVFLSVADPEREYRHQAELDPEPRTRLVKGTPGDALWPGLQGSMAFHLIQAPTLAASVFLRKERPLILWLALNSCTQAGQFSLNKRSHSPSVLNVSLSTTFQALGMNRLLPQTLGPAGAVLGDPRPKTVPVAATVTNQLPACLSTTVSNTRHPLTPCSFLPLPPPEFLTPLNRLC